MTPATHGAPWFLRIMTPLLRANAVVPLPGITKSYFILSTGRTGTVYLADLCKQAGGQLVTHEPKPSRILNAWTTAFLEGRVAPDFMAAALAAKRRKTLRGQPPGSYIEANNFIACFADALPQVFASPTVIHIIRDPREFITSLTNRYDDVGLRGWFNRHVPYWAYVPSGVHKRQLTAYTRPAYRWRALNDYLIDYGRRQPKHYQQFSFEALFDKTNPAELQRLLGALGLSAKQIAGLDFAPSKRSNPKKRLALLDRPTESSNKSRQQLMPRWPDWTPAQARQIQDICGPLMAELGYGNEPAWQQLLTQ